MKKRTCDFHLTHQMQGGGKMMIGRKLAGILVAASVILVSAVVFAQESGFKYDDMGYYSENITKVKINGKWGCISKNGVEIIPAIYDEIGEFGWLDSANIAKIKRDGKMGYNYYMYKPTYNPFNNRYLTNGFRKLSYFTFQFFFKLF